MSIGEFKEIEKTQYDLFSVTDGTRILKGNLMNASYENGVVNFTLIRRLKD